MVRILVVDDSAFMRKVISRALEAEPGFSVVAQARDGRDGVEMAERHKPDVITLDIEMPKLDGLGALREINTRMRSAKPIVLMCSSLTTEGSKEALKALRLGAADFIAKDPNTVGSPDNDFCDELVSKIRALVAHAPAREKRTLRKPGRTLGRLAGIASRRPASKETQVPDTVPDICLGSDAFDAIVIGASTGGPPIVEKLLTSMPVGLRVPIILAQHMPSIFTKSLAERLAKRCQCPVTLVDRTTDIDKPGVYLADGGSHLHLRRTSRGAAIAAPSAEPAAAAYRPSVNVLFETAAKVFGARCLAIQLTGMGEDGGKGAGLLKASGAHVLAQEASSCVVYGMPRAVIEGGFADAALTPEQLKEVLASMCGSASDSATDKTAQAA